jgi:hypothetical protein
MGENRAPPVGDDEFSSADRPPERTARQYAMAAISLIVAILPGGALLMIALASLSEGVEGVGCFLVAATLLGTLAILCARHAWNALTGPQRAWAASRRGRRRRCYRCGYDLRGSTRICAECGTPIPESYEELAARMLKIGDAPARSTELEEPEEPSEK